MDGEMSGQKDQDKSYWISKVGDMSKQLQEQHQYWSERVLQLQNHLDKIHLASSIFPVPK